jgi:hypothetical protein
MAKRLSSFNPVKIRVATPSLAKIALTCQIDSTVSVNRRFEFDNPLQSKAETQPQLHPALLPSDKMKIGGLSACNSSSFGVVLHVLHVLHSQIFAINALGRDVESLTRALPPIRPGVTLKGELAML